jgi:hypothetical protein
LVELFLRWYHCLRNWDSEALSFAQNGTWLLGVLTRCDNLANSLMIITKVDLRRAFFLNSLHAVVHVRCTRLFLMGGRSCTILNHRGLWCFTALCKVMWLLILMGILAKLEVVQWLDKTLGILRRARVTSLLAHAESHRELLGSLAGWFPQINDSLIFNGTVLFVQSQSLAR